MCRVIVVLVGLSVLYLLPGKADADVSLSDAFAACEASVVQNTNAPLLNLGTVIDQNERQQRIRLNTDNGILIASVFPPPFDNVLGCILWGRNPVLEAEYANVWQDWVEWNEVEEAAQVWYDKSLAISGSVDLTNTQQPGFVIARCAVRENGIVLANQPSVAGAVRQVLPKRDPPSNPRMFFQFSVMRALPGRCQAAVDARSDG